MEGNGCGERQEGLSDRLVEGTVKFGGGSVMVWGCMFCNGPRYACKIDGRMDGEFYVRIMEEGLKSSMDYYGETPQDVVFQQDNDSKHTCKKAKTWFEDSDLEVMEWPAQSLDLNPIEHLWSHLKKKLGEYENPPVRITELWERVEKEWNNIPSYVCQNLIESMPIRVAAVLGGYTLPQSPLILQQKSFLEALNLLNKDWVLYTPSQEPYQASLQKKWSQVQHWLYTDLSLTHTKEQVSSQILPLQATLSMKEQASFQDQTLFSPTPHPRINPSTPCPQHLKTSDCANQFCSTEIGNRLAPLYKSAKSTFWSTGPYTQQMKQR